jgi:uncharacterized protein YkwD
MREFWEQYGGLPIFGFPITPAQTEMIEGQSRQVQWFERVRMELHPENPPPYDVQLGRLGADYVARADAPGRETPQNTCRYFNETGFNVCEPILNTWQAYGLNFDGLPGFSDAEHIALFGLPLTGVYETVLPDGSMGRVLWFERARFEIHSNGSVLLGLLGAEQYAPTTSPDPVVPERPSSDAAVARVLDLTNTYRAQHGCPALVREPRLMHAAQQHSEDMAYNDFYSHTSSDGSSLGDRAHAVGYIFRSVAENIFAGPETAEDAVAGWMQSAGHRSNILNCEFRDIGIGYVYMEDDSGNVQAHHYWTQMFGTE